MTPKIIDILIVHIKAFYYDKTMMKIVKINKNLGHHSTALHMDIVYIILNIYTKLCLLLSLFSKYVATFIAQPTLLGIDNRSDNSNSSRTRKRENKRKRKRNRRQRQRQRSKERRGGSMSPLPRPQKKLLARVGIWQVETGRRGQ